MFGSLSKYPEPAWNPDRFTSLEAWAQVVLHLYFGHHFAPGQPFFIARRTLEYHENTACVKHVPNCWIGFSYFLGVVETSVTPRVTSSGAIEIAARHYVEFRRGRESKLELGTLCFKKPLFDYTPYSSSMRNPSNGEAVWAFSVATESSAAEALAIREGVTAEYLKAACMLGLTIVSPGMHAVREESVKKVLRELLYCHARPGTSDVPNSTVKEHIARFLAEARALGMAEDVDPVFIDGVRYRPAEVLEDLSRLYQVAAP